MFQFFFITFHNAPFYLSFTDFNTTEPKWVQSLTASLQVTVSQVTTSLQVEVSQMTTSLQVIQEGMDAIKASRKVVNKNGSDMNETILRLITSMEPNISAISNVIKLSVKEEVAHECYDALWRYSQESNTYKQKKNYDEVRYVQPRSLVLLQKFFQMIFPEYFQELLFCRKAKKIDGGEFSMTKYNTTAGLFSNDTSYIITGEVDISVCYFGVCIFVWEDKSLDKSLLPAVEKGEIVVEVKGFGEKFKEFTKYEARRFCGVETTGLVWRFCFRNFVPEDGSFVYVLTQPHSVSDESDTKIVSDVLIHCISGCADLIDDMNKRFRKVTSITTNEKDDETNEKDADTGFDDESSDVLHDFHQMGLSSSNSISKSSQWKPASSNNNENNGTKRSSGLHKTKRQPLREIKQNELTPYALYLHTQQTEI